MNPNLLCSYCGEVIVSEVGDYDCLLIEPCGCAASTADLTAERDRLREVLAAAKKFIPVAGPDGYSTALADAIAQYDREKEAKP